MVEMSQIAVGEAFTLGRASLERFRPNRFIVDATESSKIWFASYIDKKAVLPCMKDDLYGQTYHFAHR